VGLGVLGGGLGGRVGMMGGEGWSGDRILENIWVFLIEISLLVLIWKWIQILMVIEMLWCSAYLRSEASSVFRSPMSE